MNPDFERFFFTALHDLKAPLRAIDHLSQWIAEDLGSIAKGESVENPRPLRQRPRRMAPLLDGLQAYGRADSDAGAPERVDLQVLAESLLAELPTRPGIEVQIGSGLGSVQARRAEITQVLRALLENAVRHHDKGQGWVRVEATTADGGLKVSVRDNGPGIAPEHHARILEPFQTLKPRDEAEGAGLGLAIADKLLKKNNAALRLESQPGQGSAFWFVWPHGA